MTNILELLKNEKVEWKKLGEVCEIIAGGDAPRLNMSKSRDENYKIPIVSNGIGENSIYGWTNIEKISEPSITISARGTIGWTNLILEPFYPVVRLLVLTPKIKVNIKYIYYIMKNKENTYILPKTGIPQLTKPMIIDVEIPIPSLETQEKIVKILDKFTNYVKELQSELQSRTKQYTYYRDKLLSEEYLTKVTKEMEEDRRLNIVTLGEVGEFTRGNGLQKKDFQEEGNPVIHYGQIYTKYGFVADEVLSYVSDEIFSKLRKAQKNDILIATTSENVEDVGKSVVWVGEDEIGFSGDMYSYRTKQNSKYIAYYFQTNAFQRQKERKVTGTKMTRIHGDDMEKIEIPLPPLSLQNKIVKVLDKFQILLADTKGLIPEEIKQRQKQYEYYREKLLTFDVECSRTNERTNERTFIISNIYYDILQEAAKYVGIILEDKVIEYRLRDIAEYSSSRISAEELDTFNYVGVDNLLKDKYGREDSTYIPEKGTSIKYEKNDILIGNIRPYLRKIWYSDRTGGTNGDVLAISVKDIKLVDSRYLYHALADERFFEYNIKYSKGAKMPRGDKKKIMEYHFPIPPLHVQQHVVSILDKFDTLVNDIKEGLPKEIEQRQQQYEYWRECLLNFPR